jgi:flagellar biosynthesis GTPase FlhF
LHSFGSRKGKIAQKIPVCIPLCLSGWQIIPDFQANYSIAILNIIVILVLTLQHNQRETQTITLKQNNIMSQYIINARQFNTVQEYVAAVGLTDFDGQWMDLARQLGVEINPKGGRRSIYDAWKKLNADQPDATTTTKTAVSTKVAVVQKAATVQVPVVTADVIDDVVDAVVIDTPAVAVAVPVAAAKSKAPRRMDYNDEDEFDAAMTEWIIANPRPATAKNQPATQPVAPVAPVAQPVAIVAVKPEPIAKPEPVAVKPEPAATQPVQQPVAKSVSKPAPIAANPVQSIDTDNVEETALQLAKLLAGMKPKAANAEVDLTKLAQMIQDSVYDECKDLRDDIKLGLAELWEGLVDLKNQLTSNVQTIQVQVNDLAPVKINGAVHYQFENILRHVSVRDNVMLVGPAGSGKTTVSKQVADAVELPFYATSICAQTTEAKLFGYMSATGEYVRTIFREAYENGGVFLIDEMDSGNANVLTALNAALDNGFCPFPDQMINMHPDFVCIAGANTYGSGATREYVGRNQLDSATLDRFSVLDFGYDEKLETKLAPEAKWAKCVQAIRAELSNERVVISPRATIRGGRLLAAGCTPEYVLQVRVIKGMTPALADRTRAVFNRFYK